MLYSIRLINYETLPPSFTADESIATANEAVTTQTSPNRIDSAPEVIAFGLVVAGMSMASIGLAVMNSRSRRNQTNNSDSEK